MAKVTLPAGPTPLRKNLASGMDLKAAEAKALGKSGGGAGPKTPRK